MSNLVWNINNLRGLSIKDASDAFSKWAWERPARNQGHWGPALNRIGLHDLALQNQGLPSNGLYVFYDSSGVMPVIRYVGKCTSRSFLERIPAHLESREECWFNTLTKRAFDHLPPGDDGAAPSLASASEFCLKYISVALIPIDCGDRDPNKTSRVGMLERRLRDPKGLAPAWNTCHTKVKGSYLSGDALLVDDLLQLPLEPVKPAL